MSKILLIEDNKELSENIAEILSLAQYDVITAENGKEGVALAIKEQPDLVVCDIMMPVLDGYGTLHLMSKNPDTQHIPFIFLTAKTDHLDLRKGMEMGADDYLTKPFDDIELLNAIEVRLKKSKLQRKQNQESASKQEEQTINVKSFIESLNDPASQTYQVRSYKKRDCIYKEGAYAKGVYYINDGKIKISRTNESGKELITEIYNKGDFFGILNVFNDSPYSEAAIVLEDVDITLIPKDDCKALVFNNPDISQHFIKALSNNVIEVHNKLIQVAYNSVRKRVAESLVDLCSKFNVANEKHIKINMVRDDLAHIVGTATETLIRVLTDFKEDNIIEMDRSQITILAYEKLVNMRN